MSGAVLVRIVHPCTMPELLYPSLPAFYTCEVCGSTWDWSAALSDLWTDPVMVGPFWRRGLVQPTAPVRRGHWCWKARTSVWVPQEEAAGLRLDSSLPWAVR